MSRSKFFQQARAILVEDDEPPLLEGEAPQPRLPKLPSIDVAGLRVHPFYFGLEILGWFFLFSILFFAISPRGLGGSWISWLIWSFLLQPASFNTQIVALSLLIFTLKKRPRLNEILIQANAGYQFVLLLRVLWH